jgi:hypothetical protein
MTAAICHALDMDRKRSPQEKKILSYLKDGRNKYGENDKAARKAIPARKAWVNRTYRRTVRQAARHGAADIETTSPQYDAKAGRSGPTNRSLAI